MPRLAALRLAVPPYAVGQDEARRLCEAIYAGQPKVLDLLRVFPACGVETRHVSFPPSYYAEKRSFDDRNADFIVKAVDLAAEAARDALRRAKLRPEEIDHIVLSTTTGLATPSLDALLVGRLGLRSDVRRWPLFGLGCAGGVGALGRAAEILQGAPRQRALVVAVELCGQVFSHEARTPVDVVGCALFGDGAAAGVVAGDEAGEVEGPRILRSRSLLFAGSEELMGWKFTSDGLRLVLAESITGLLRSRLKEAVAAVLGADGAAHWALHPGGRKILEAYGETLGLSAKDLAWSRSSLARYGNVSSASALFVLADLLDAGVARAGERALLAAPGPGFGLESVVLAW